MKELTTKELMDLQLDILIKIDKFCRSNSIRYFIGYGTLIGAVRHGGYIPWDDDIDIGMPRPDYDRFRQLFPNSFPELTFLCPENNTKYYAPYGNVYDNRTLLIEPTIHHFCKELGVKIDVFPIDGVPDDQHEYLELKKRCEYLNTILQAKRYTIKGLLSNKPKVILHYIKYRLRYAFVSYSSIQCEIMRLAKKNDYEKCQYVDKVTFTNYGCSPHWDKNVYEEYIDIDFEGRKVRTIKNFHAHLTALYGDYMKLPPLDQQVPHHGFKAYWK